MKTLIILFALISSFSLSQECNYEVNEKDDMTGVFKKKTKYIRMVREMTTASGIQFCKIDTTYYLSVMWGTSGVIDKNCQLIFKFDNDSIMKLYPVGIYSSRYEVDHNVIEPSYVISRDQLKKFTNNKIKKARLYTTKGYAEGEVKDKYIVPIQQAANCIMN